MRSEISSTPAREFWSGIRAVLPLFIGVLPFGLIYGTLARRASLPAPAAQAMSAIIFAGSAQFLVAQLYAFSAPALVIIFTIAIVNLRHTLYSASIGPDLQSLSPFWKGILAYLLTDEAYAVVITHFHSDHPAPYKQWFFLGAGFGLWICWQTSTALGLLAGAIVPASWSLDFTISLTFIALVIPTLKDRAVVGAAVAAGLVAILTNTLPDKLWILAAAAAGILVGILLEGKK